MCGIFGYVGKRKNAGDLVLAGLKKLEYRGYDSWGVACFNGRCLEVLKKVGKIGDAHPTFSQSSLAVGQTRWATHGKVTVANAHPHLDCYGRIAVVHNGIVENYQELKRKLKRKHVFRSETDTEIIAHLIEEILAEKKDFREALRTVFLKLEGLNAMVALDMQDRQIIGVKNGSPLVVGVGEGENFIASDALAIVSHTGKAIFLADKKMVCLRKDDVCLYDVKDGRGEKPQITHINWHFEKETRGRYRHFLLKEIYEQPRVVERIVREGSHEIVHLAELVRRSFGAYLIGCGTAAYACLAGTYFSSCVAKHHLNFSTGSEFNYLEDFITRRSLVVGVSQSGETADIVESTNRAKKKGAKIAAIVNVVGSTLFRLADYKVLIGAGQERAVVSTKAFIGQVSILLLLAYALAHKFREGQKMLTKARRSLRFVLGLSSQRKIKSLAKRIGKKEHVYVVGRGISYPAALEVALKIKETSYIHAEGFAAGELKHGVIALIEKDTPCLVLAPRDETYGATLAGAMEVKARGGYIIGLSDRNNGVFDYFLKVPYVGTASLIPNVAVGQTLAYYLALLRNCDPDKPRNLAKSVTVR